MSSCKGFLGAGLKPLLKVVMLVLMLLQLAFFFICRQIILAMQANNMQIQKAAFQSSSTSLFKQNFKTNRNSIRTIDRYLLESSFQHQLLENCNMNNSIFSKKSQVQKGILNKTMNRSNSSQFPEFKGFLCSNGLSKVQSVQDGFDEDSAAKIQKLQKQTEEQKIIIALQEELINKLMAKFQNHVPQETKEKTQSDVAKERPQVSQVSNFQRLRKVRQLLESSVQSL